MLTLQVVLTKPAEIWRLHSASTCQASLSYGLQLVMAASREVSWGCELEWLLSPQWGFSMWLGHPQCGSWVPRNQWRWALQISLFFIFIEVLLLYNVKFQGYNIVFTFFKGYIPFVVFIKYWLSSLCCTLYPCSLFILYGNCKSLTAQCCKLYSIIPCILYAACQSKS